MALKDSYTITTDSRFQTYDTRWGCQTFTTSSSYTIESVDLYLYRDGDPGTVTVSIYATSSSLPTGSALASMTMTGTDLPEGSEAADWYNFVFDTPYALSDATEYAIVVSCTGADSSNDVNVRYKIEGTYADGQFAYSTNGGSDWTGGSSDAVFKTYSVADLVYEDIAGSISATSSLTGALSGATIDMEGTISGVGSLVGNLGGFISLSGTISATSSLSGVLTLGPLSGIKAEKAIKRLVAIGNDGLYYEDL